MQLTNTRDPNDTRSVDEQLDPVQYAKRDAAWARVCDAHKFRERHHSVAVAAMHDCFNAGWAERKRAEVETMLEKRMPRTDTADVSRRVVQP